MSEALPGRFIIAEEEEEEVLGDPSFELLVRDGVPIVGGCYFIYPPLRAVEAKWDDSVPERIVVRASDGSDWFVDGVSRVGTLSVVLRPLSGSHPAYAKKGIGSND